jgi:hypothetical protein
VSPLNVVFDHTDEIAERIPDAIDAGLQAAAYVYRDEVMRALAGGYTTGDFVTGRAMNSVAISEPYDVDDDRAISVGTDLDYPMFWELGHHNIFTRRFERVEIWAPALDAMSPEMMDVFNGTALSWIVQGAP